MQKIQLLSTTLSVISVAIQYLAWPFLIAVYAGLFLWLRNPPAPPKTVSNFFNGFRFGGHRGSPVNAPENTMASFKKAESEGVDLIEFDVGLTKDNVPVLLHDETLDRTTNMNGLLRERQFAELATCNCAAKFNGTLTNEPEPLVTLEEIVRWAKPKGMKMIFDIKDRDKELVDQVLQLFEEYDLYDSAIVCSFFPWVIYCIKRRNENILTGMTSRRWFAGDGHPKCYYMPRRCASFLHGLATFMDVLCMWSIKLWLAKALGADMVLTERGEISEKYVKYMRARGLEVCSWTVNDEREMDWMANKLQIPFLTDVPSLAFPIARGCERTARRISNMIAEPAGRKCLRVA